MIVIDCPPVDVHVPLSRLALPVDICSPVWTNCCLDLPLALGGSYAVQTSALSAVNPHQPLHVARASFAHPLPPTLAWGLPPQLAAQDHGSAWLVWANDCEVQVHDPASGYRMRVPVLWLTDLLQFPAQVRQVVAPEDGGQTLIRAMQSYIQEHHGALALFRARLGNGERHAALAQVYGMDLDGMTQQVDAEQTALDSMVAAAVEPAALLSDTAVWHMATMLAYLVGEQVVPPPPLPEIA